MRVAMYARVSRLDQEPDNQLHELRRYVAARGWEAVAFVEHVVMVGTRGHAASVVAESAVATVDHSDIRGSEPHNRDPSGAASD